MKPAVNLLVEASYHGCQMTALTPGSGRIVRRWLVTTDEHFGLWSKCMRQMSNGGLP
jgi:hypothetical protein